MNPLRVWGHLERLERDTERAFGRCETFCTACAAQVELGLEIVKLVPGYVSTEVDIRASFDTDESVRRARRIIAMYEAAGVDRSRVLVKLAGTWEGIKAAEILELKGGDQVNF